jgi:hypothetical protein
MIIKHIQEAHKDFAHDGWGHCWLAQQCMPFTLLRYIRIKPPLADACPSV